ncbi:TIGR04141 family sporadically distributed protein [Kribbella sp. NPDC056861]|uniref:TIGR04141 family sporadically distributed protein n=1 Tax=Kribbella sp. NPDC056861 TaxID=3154857 RepID=UPI00342AB54E
MVTKVPGTRAVTLHRLWRTPPDAGSLLDLLDHEQLDELEDLDFGPVTVADEAGLWVQGSFRTRDGESAEWCLAAQRTLGREVHFSDSRSAGLLMLIVDGRAYAIGYGQGHRLLPGDQKDRRFGLEFATRALDPTQVHKLLRRRPGARGRTETTLMPNGSPIWAFEVGDGYADLVGRASGKSQSIQLSRSRPLHPVSIDGGVGLQIRLATDPKELVADIRTIAEVLDRNRRPELEYIDRIRSVQDDTLAGLLDLDLEGLLGSPVDAVRHCLSSVVPMDLAEHTEEIHGYLVRLGAGTRKASEITLEGLLDRAHILRPGTRLQGFREGRVQAYADEACTLMLGGNRAVEWLEAVLSMDDRHFAMVDGHWYEIDAEYRDRLRERVRQVLDVRSALELPPWQSGDSERQYNENAELDKDLGLLCLDRKGVKDEWHTKWGFEACDLLGPDNELIHVKQATGSAPLSHLFTQACVAVQALEGSTEARLRFRELVQKHGKGRELPPSFLPTKVVFGILLKKGDVVTPETLFPFAQVALVQAVGVLQSARTPIQVEVRAIDLEESGAAAAHVESL